MSINTILYIMLSNDNSVDMDTIERREREHIRDNAKYTGNKPDQEARPDQMDGQYRPITECRENIIAMAMVAMVDAH